MPNTGNTQQQINYGAAANDGLGDPLRTAFIKTDENFDNIWLAGPVGSNITITNNTIAVNNTNGNLVLQPNATGIIQTRGSLQSFANNIHNLGTANLRYLGGYFGAGGLDVTGTITAGNIGATGNLTATGTLSATNLLINGDAQITGNLRVQGDIIQVGNIVTDTLTIQLANTAANGSQANGAGITVGAADDIATLLYSSAGNVWTTNIGLTVGGNITGDYILGNGAFLTGLPEQYGNANVANYLPTFTGNLAGSNLEISSSSNTWTISGQYITGPGGAYWHSHPEQQQSVFASAPGEFVSIRSIDVSSNIEAELYLGNTYAEIFVDNGINHRWRFNESGVLETSGDIVPVTPGSVPADIGNATNPWTDAYFSGTITSGNILPQANATYSLGNVDLQWSNLWVANNTIYIGGVPIGITAGNVLIVGGEPILSNDSNTSITTTGNITADYFLGNGSQLTGLNTNSISNGNSNVEIATADGNISVTAAGTYNWIFDDTGNLTLPNNGSIIVDGDGVIGPVSDDFVISWDNEEIRLVSVQGSIEMQADSSFRVQTSYDAPNVMYGSRWEFSNNEIVNITSDFGIVSEAGDLTLSGGRDGVNSGNTTVRAVNQGVAVYDWTFGNDGVLTAPGNITTTGNVEAGYVYGDTTEANVFVGGTANISGNINFGNGSKIQTATNNINLQSNVNGAVEIKSDGGNYTWAFDNYGWATLPEADAAYTPVANGSVMFAPTALTFKAGLANLTFESTGDLSVPGNVTANYFIGDGSQLTGLPAQYGDANVASFLAAYGSNTISTTGNVTAGNFLGAGSNVDIVAGNYDWTFANDGNLTLPGNTFAVNYANGTQVALGGNYGNSNVATFLANFGSNTISTTGNITAGNISGNISITGNVTGTSANVDIIAGSYQWTFNNAGNLVLPGNTFTVNYANGTAVTLGGTYGNANVADFLDSLGSNAIITTGNITAGNLISSGAATTGVNALLAGPTFTPLANTSAGFVANVNSYSQITFQNRSTGADATADYILTADNGSDTVNYGDFGIINSGYDINTPTNSLGNIVRAGDTYLYAQGNVSNTSQSGGNLIIGTTVPTKTVKIFAGGANNNALIANISSTGIAVTGNVTANNFSGNISLTGNIQGTSANVELVAGSYTFTFDNVGVATFPAVGGDEGGEINFGIPTANTTLTGPVKFDVYQDRIRFFDGSAKGVYIDMAQAGAGVSTLLNNRISGLVNAGTFVTMDNIKATVTSSAPRGLSLATVSGSFSYNIGGNFALSGGPGGSVLAGQTLTTTPTTSIFGWGFTVSGDLSTYVLTDTTNNRCYRITLQIGASFNNNSIVIERLI